MDGKAQVGILNPVGRGASRGRLDPASDVGVPAGDAGDSGSHIAICKMAGNRVGC